MTTRKNATRAKAPRRQGHRKINYPKLVLMVILVLFTLGYSGWHIWNSDYIQTRYVYMWDYQQDIVTYSRKNQVDPFLVAAIIKNESGFKPNVVSSVGAIGLMQIMPDSGYWIAKQMGLQDYRSADLYKAKQNIRMGCWYLGELLYEFQGNEALALMAYNAGRGKTKQWMEEQGWNYEFYDIKSIPYPESRAYVIKVLYDKRRYKDLYNKEVDEKMKALPLMKRNSEEQEDVGR